jgi:hypothetical protein
MIRTEAVTDIPLRFESIRSRVSTHAPVVASARSTASPSPITTSAQLRRARAGIVSVVTHY